MIYVFTKKPLLFYFAATDKNSAHFKAYIRYAIQKGIKHSCIG